MATALDQENKEVEASTAKVDLNEIVRRIRDELMQPVEDGPVKLEFFHKLYEIPLIGSYVDLTWTLYKKVRGSNCVSYRMMKTAEKTIIHVRQRTEPIVNMVKIPLVKLDYLLCASLGILEEKVPSIMLPPEQILRNTANFIKDLATGKCALDCMKETCKFTKDQAEKCQNALFQGDNKSGVQVVEFDGFPPVPYTTAQEAQMSVSPRNIYDKILSSLNKKVGARALDVSLQMSIRRTVSNIELIQDTLLAYRELALVRP